MDSKAGCSARPSSPVSPPSSIRRPYVERSDRVGAAAGDAQQPAGVALADQRRAVRQERDAPRDREPGDHLAGDLRVRRGRLGRRGVAVSVGVGVGVGASRSSSCWPSCWVQPTGPATRRTARRRCTPPARPARRQRPRAAAPAWSCVRPWGERRLRAMGMEDLDPIETASVDELRSLQLERLRCDGPRTRTRTSPHYREAFDAAGVHPDDVRELSRPGRLPVHRPRPTCGPTTRSGCSPCRASRWSGCTPPAARRASPTVVGYTAEDIDMWADGDGPLDPGGRRPPGRRGAQGVRLRPVHRRPRRPLRRRGARLHGGPRLGRHDRAPGHADPRLRARRSSW